MRPRLTRHRVRFVALGTLLALVLTGCAPAAPAAPTAAPKAAEAKPAATQPVAKPAAEAKPTAAAKPAEAKPAEKPTAAAKPADAKPTAAAQAPAKPSGPEPKRGGALRISTDGDWKTLDPAVYTNITDRQLLFAIYDSLVTMDENINIGPGLARSWQVSPDALEWTFSLTSGVKFHDGTPFNAQAVKFNLDRILNPETASRLRQDLLDIKEVQVVDDLTVKIVLKQPFTPLLSWLAEIPGMMSSPAAIQKWGKEYGDHPVGTGPFEFVEQVKGDHIKLRRFSEYWRSGLPYVDEVTYRPVPDPSTKLSSLRAGTLDILDEVPPREFANLSSSSDIKLGQMEGTRWPMIRLNLAKPPLDNKAVRQALALAIDRDAIVRAIYFGNARPAFGPIAPMYKATYDPAIEQLGFNRDVARAKQKLAEGGQPNGFTIALEITGTPEQTRLAELIKAQWAEIGVTAEISSYETNTLVDRLRNGAFTASIGSWTPRPDVDGVVYRHFRSGSPFNYGKYENARVDELLDQTRRLLPGDERVKAFREAERLIVDEAPWLFLVFENQAFGMARYVEGLPLIPDTMIRPATVWLNR